VFLDLKLGADDGLEVLGRLMKVRPAPAVILFTAYANIATAVEAMRRGAFDFIPKPFTPDQIRAVLAKVAKAHALERRVQALESDLASGAPPVDLESASRRCSAPSRSPSRPPRPREHPDPGAQRHRQERARPRDPQAQRPARGGLRHGQLPEPLPELLESELFGHARGSFTGPSPRPSGKVAAADGGTLFLDEIGEMPLEIQPKLLRLLQEREYERVGEAVPRRADVRVIAATNRDLAPR
jgi:two-component system, NtrC family, response regulator AlgB